MSVIESHRVISNDGSLVTYDLTTGVDYTIFLGAFADLMLIGFIQVKIMGDKSELLRLYLKPEYTHMKNGSIHCYIRGVDYTIFLQATCQLFPLISIFRLDCQKFAVPFLVTP